MLSSLAKTCGSKAIGLLLTGMGNDGADGLLDMRKASAHTIVQSPETCVVPGMPNSALQLEAVDKIVPLEQLAEYLVKIAGLSEASSAVGS
jgi:two-component system, chemotaxis family, protein-glutamate methylesterase/glutaminase